MTPALTLWRALNAEPERGETTAEFRAWSKWWDDYHDFNASHPADQLSYFEGKVRGKGCQQIIHSPQPYNFDGLWDVRQEHPDGWDVIVTAPTEHTARLIAAARAIHALGMITDAQLKEVEDA